MTFETFTRKGVKFIAIPAGNDIVICDQNGRNFGRYFDIKSFEAFAARNGGFNAITLGRATLSMQVSPV